jgi:hypothetical protein
MVLRAPLGALQIPHFVRDDKGRGRLKLELLLDGENSLVLGTGMRRPMPSSMAANISVLCLEQASAVLLEARRVSGFSPGSEPGTCVRRF